MKKLLLAVITSLALCGSVFAQYTSHWPEFNDGPFEDQVALVAAIMIDGQVINITDANWEALEVGFFVGDECRGNENFLFDGVTEFGDPYPTLDGRPIFYSGTTQEAVSFKLYDHMNNILYEDGVATLQGAPITIVTAGDDHLEGWDDPDNPIILCFTSPAEPEIIIWDEPGDWPSGEIPPAGGDVIIPDNSIVVIPEDYTANVGEITIPSNSQIVIEEGGQLYHSGEVEVTFEMDTVEGYNSKSGTGYRLFACPVTTTSGGSTRPVEGTNLNTGDFDLYKFDEGAADGLEWINYKKNTDYNSDPTNPANVNFENLVKTEGYLYANATQTTNIVMSGFTPSTAANSLVSTSLKMTSGAEFEGMNLVGNPYSCKAYVSNDNGDMPYYVMNANGDGFEAKAASTSISTMKAVFVVATENNETCMFKTVATPQSKGTLNITVNQGRGMVDNAILSFGSANTLEKFQFNPNHTKVYMPVDGKDYAVASAGEMGEMPVNFKAESNGSYSLNFSSEEVSFNYLHLIDNMTGADVDLLATPYYTFDAKTTDYASRFKLVYATGDNTEDNFAFFSNGSFVISNEGEATLQVVDVMGRIVKSESINGSASVNVDAAAGVYMLRLVSANGEKVQKIVVK